MKIKRWIGQVFRGWFPVEPKKSNQWLKNKLTLLGLSATVVSMITLGVLNHIASPQAIIPQPIFTGEYNPGISVGDYVVYGNFVCNKDHRWGSHLCINDFAFKKIEVIAVSGKEVTLLYTEQLKNGSATWRDSQTLTWNVEKGDFSDDTDYDLYSLDWNPIVAANITEGNCTVSGCEKPECEGVKTEVRTYLGVNRNVVIRSRCRVISETRWQKFWISENYVYDQLSGIRLEVELVTLDDDLYQGFSVVETNIFQNPNMSLSSFQKNKLEIPTIALYSTIGTVIIAIFVGTGIIIKRKISVGGETNNEN